MPQRNRRTEGARSSATEKTHCRKPAYPHKTSMRPVHGGSRHGGMPQVGVGPIEVLSSLPVRVRVNFFTFIGYIAEESTSQQAVAIT